MPQLTEAEAEARLSGLRASAQGLRAEADTQPLATAPVATGKEEPFESARPLSRYRYVKPLHLAADSLVAIYRNVEGRFMFGLDEIDHRTRGIGNGELCYLTGRSHTGKTQVFMEGVLHNADRPIVLFTIDETREIVLSKLYSMVTGSNAEMVENEVRAGNNELVRDIKRVARSRFENFLCIDDAVTLESMGIAIKEAVDYYGRPIGGVGIDFLDLIEGENDGDGTARKSKAVKLAIKEWDVPGIVVHQGSRGNSGKGQKLGMEAMRFGGENEALFVIGVRRAIDDPDLDEAAFERVKNQVSVGLIKNKRPPMRRGEWDFFMDPDTGSIRPWQDEDFFDARQPRYPAEAEPEQETRKLW